MSIISFRVDVIWPAIKNIRVFLKISILTLPLKNVLCLKSKISNTLVQLSGIFLIIRNQQQRNLKDLKKEKNNSYSLNKFYWLSSTGKFLSFKFCNFTLWMPPCLGCSGPSPRSPPLCTPLFRVRKTPVENTTQNPEIPYFDIVCEFVVHYSTECVHSNSAWFF